MDQEFARATPSHGPERAEEVESFIHDRRQWRHFAERQEKKGDTRLLALFVEMGQVATTVAAGSDLSR